VFTARYGLGILRIIYVKLSPQSGLAMALAAC